MTIVESLPTYGIHYFEVKVRKFGSFIFTVKPVFSGHSKRTQKIGFTYRISPNAGQKYCRMLQGEHSAALLTFIKLPFSIKTFILSILKWPLKTGLTVTNVLMLYVPVNDFSVMSEHFLG